MRENCLESVFIQLAATAGVTKIVRDQIEALSLGRAVAGEVDDDRVFGLGALQPIKRSRLLMSAVPVLPPAASRPKENSPWWRSRSAAE